MTNKKREVLAFQKLRSQLRLCVCALGAPLYPPVLFNTSGSGSFTYEGRGYLELKPSPSHPTPVLAWYKAC